MVDYCSWCSADRTKLPPIDVASVHSGDVVVVVVVISVVVAQADDLCCRCCGGGEYGSGRIMVGPRLLRVDAERALSPSLSAGMCVCVSLCICVVSVSLSVCTPAPVRALKGKWLELSLPVVPIVHGSRRMY